MKYVLTLLIVISSLFSFSQTINAKRVEIDFAPDFIKIMKFKNGKLFFEKKINNNEFLFYVKSRSRRRGISKDTIAYYILDTRAKKLSSYINNNEIRNRGLKSLDSIRKNCIENEIGCSFDSEDCFWMITNYGQGLSKYYLNNDILIKERIAVYKEALLSIHNLDKYNLLFTKEGALDNDYYEIPYIFNKKTLQTQPFKHSNKILRIYGVYQNKVLFYDIDRGRQIGELSKDNSYFENTSIIKGIENNGNLILANGEQIIMYNKSWWKNKVMFIYSISK